MSAEAVPAVDDGGELITKAECARRLGITPGRVSQITATGGRLADAMGPNNLVRWPLAQKLYGARIDGSKSRPAADDGSGRIRVLDDDDRAIKAARRRKMEADADAAEADRLQRFAQLVARDAVEAAIFTAARALRDRLLTIPAAVAGEASAISEPREIQALLDLRLRAVMLDFHRDMQHLASAPDDAAADA